MIPQRMRVILRAWHDDFKSVPEKFEIGTDTLRRVDLIRRSYNGNRDAIRELADAVKTEFTSELGFMPNQKTTIASTFDIGKKQTHLSDIFNEQIEFYYLAKKYLESPR